MRTMAKIMGWTAMLGIGLLIGGLIVGTRATWIWGIVLFLGSIILGPAFQYAADRKDGAYDHFYEARATSAEKEKPMPKEHERQEEKGESFYSPEEQEIILNLMKRQIRLERLKEGEADVGDDLKDNERLLSMHKESYMRIKEEHGCLRHVSGIEEDAAGQLLRTVCSCMLYSPNPNRDFCALRAVCSIEICGAQTLAYSFSPTAFQPIFYSWVFLVRTEDNEIRFFTLERSSDRFQYLCEFKSGRHINYEAVAKASEAFDRIEAILNKEKENK